MTSCSRLNLEIEYQARWYSWMYGTRKKRPSRKLSGYLPTASLQVAFVLYYLKNYSLLETFAERLPMDKSIVSKKLHFYLTRLQEVLLNWGTHRPFESAEALQNYMLVHQWDKIF